MESTASKLLPPDKKTLSEESLEIPALSPCSKCSRQWGLSHIPKETPAQALHLPLRKGFCLAAW